MNRSHRNAFLASLTILISGCTTSQHKEAKDSAPALRYVGSSTIANFIREAKPAYHQVQFALDTEPESVGGEAAILEGRADLAGVAGDPKPETLKKGVAASLIGKDAIAVIVNQSNPIADLTRIQLKEIFTGKVRNWREFGGPDLAIHPFIVGPASATRNVFRSAILGDADYAGCEVVRPDANVVMKVEAEQGGIGQISFSFLNACGHAKALAVDGQAPSPLNPNYSITRPLYLLWWPGRARVAEFVSWTRTSQAQSLLLKRFALARAEEVDGKLGGAR